jgi:hypothetical protein
LATSLDFLHLSGRRMGFVGGLLLLVSLLGALPAAGQTWDTTGNGQLNGTYYFREVSYATDESGDITDGTSAYGNITFSGSWNLYDRCRPGFRCVPGRSRTILADGHVFDLGQRLRIHEQPQYGVERHTDPLGWFRTAFS